MTGESSRKADEMDAIRSAPAQLILSEKQAAKELCLSVRTLQTMRVDGGGPAYVRLTERRIGYSMTELKRWVEARSVRSTSQESTNRRIPKITVRRARDHIS